MHPASSIVLFTTSAGAGYGLLFLLGLAVPAGLLPPERWLGVVALALTLGLITLGLLASTFHLGHPERAWRALSQWRSSWLSREGVAALVTFLPTGLFGFGWVLFEQADGIWVICALLAALGALITVFCTGMIYASLKTIRQWFDPLVVPLYLLFALATGALWLNFVLHLFGQAEGWSQALALLALVPAWGVKTIYWRGIDHGKSPSTPESATGLGALGQVRLLDPPHSEENYLLHEMGFRIVRKHAKKLRLIALVVGFLAAFVLALVSLMTSGGLAAAAAFLAAVAGSLGALLERWLFFAEATHTVMLYYGARAA